MLAAFICMLGARRSRRHVGTALDVRRHDEVLVQVVDVLDHATLTAAADGDEVEHGKVLHGLAEADAAGMRADRHAELRGEQQVRDVLVDAAHADGVDLHDGDGIGLQQLLEDHPVLRVLAGGDADGGDAAGDLGVAEDVVGTGGLLDPGRVELREGVHPLDRLGDLPALVGVDRDREIRSAHLARLAEAADVVVEVCTDLELDLREAVGHRLASQALQLLVGVAEPAGARRVPRVSGGDQLLLAGPPSRFGVTQDAQRILAGERVGQVAEVHEVDELLRRHPGEELPERETCALGLDVPQGVDHGADRHVHDALLRAEPAQLRVADELAEGAAHVVQQRLELATDEVAGEGVDRRDLHVVAAADREDEGVALDLVVRVGAYDHVGRRVVGVGVHRIRAVEAERCGKADVCGVECDDPGHGFLPGASEMTRTSWSVNIGCLYCQ